MRKATDFMNDIITASHSITVPKGFSVKEYPAKKLDSYMKEQYFYIMLYVASQSDISQPEILNHILYIAKQSELPLNPEDYVKSVYSMNESRIDDCIVSFDDDNIKYLLCFELYLITHSLANNIPKDLFYDIIHRFDIEGSISVFSALSKMLLDDSLAAYDDKAFCIYSDIFDCYTYKYDFVSERELVISNCLYEIRDGDTSSGMITGVFNRAEFKSKYELKHYDWVETNTELGHFTAYAFFAVTMFTSGSPSSSPKWKQLEAEEDKVLASPKLKRYNKFQINPYDLKPIRAGKSGVFHFIYNGINEYNWPFAVIAHPLDKPNEVAEYLDNSIRSVIAKNEKNKC